MSVLFLDDERPAASAPLPATCIEAQKDGIRWLRFPWIEEWAPCRALFSCRAGGCSPFPWDSLNLGFTVHDDGVRVRANRLKFYQATGLPGDRAVAVHQVHGRRLFPATAEQFGAGAWDDVNAPHGYDSVVTCERQMPLLLTCADCVPIYLADRKGRAIGLVHAGWRGTVARAAEEAVAALHDRYGVTPRDLRALLGPSIGPCCYQVDEVVAQAARESLPFGEAWLEPDGPQHYRFDLWRGNHAVLRAMGVPAEQIQITGLCTCCHDALLFSHRKGFEGRTGRALAVLMLN